MGIIDMHTHIGRWSPQHNFSKDVLYEAFEGNNVAYYIVSNLSGIGIDPEKERRQPFLDETQANTEIYEEFKDDPKALLYAVCDPANGYPERIKAIFDKYPNKFIGLKLHPEVNHIPANSELYDEYMELAKELDVPCLFHSGPMDCSYSSPKLIYQLAQRHPKVKIILGHLSNGDTNSKIKATEIMVESIKLNNSQLYCDISFCNDSIIINLLKSMPKNRDRILFGSDCPMVNMGQRAYYTHFLLNFIIKPIKKAFDEDADEVLYELFIGSAKKIFKIPVSK